MGLDHHHCQKTAERDTCCHSRPFPLPAPTSQPPPTTAKRDIGCPSWPFSGYSDAPPAPTSPPPPPLTTAERDPCCPSQPFSLPTPTSPPPTTAKRDIRCPSWPFSVYSRALPAPALQPPPPPTDGCSNPSIRPHHHQAMSCKSSGQRSLTRFFCTPYAGE